jgi:hypothetical protein
MYCNSTAEPCGPVMEALLFVLVEDCVPETLQ